MSRVSCRRPRRRQEKGELLFRRRGTACQNRGGPPLADDTGRKAGSVDGACHGHGMRHVGVTWGTARRETSLADARAMVAGMAMTMAVPRAADRTGIIASLMGPPAAPTFSQGA